MDRTLRSRTRSAQRHLAGLGLAALTAAALASGAPAAAAADPAPAAPPAPATSPGGFSPRAAHGSTRPAAPRAVVGQVLLPGQALAPGDALSSPSGRFGLVMSTDGALVLQKAPNPLNPRTYETVLGLGDAGSRLVLQTDGNLVLYGPDGTVFEETATAGSDTQRLAVNDDGNVVLYGPADAVVYEFDTDDPGSLFQGGTLLPGERLTSDDGGTTLVMQTDGNLVLYSGGTARFATGTSSPGAGLVFQEDGNVVLYSPARRALFSTRSGGTGADELAVLDREFELFALGDETVVAVFGSAWGTPVVESGAQLVRGDRRTAGGVLLVLQEDGDLVQYAGGRQVFATGTRADLAIMQPDGNFVLYAADGEDLRAVFNTRTGGFPGSRLVVQTDRNLVVYTPDDRAVFSTRR